MQSYKFSLSFILLVIILIFFSSGCSPSTGGGNGGSTSDEPYTFNVSSTERIKSEYTQYLLARSERRPIWIGGNLFGVATPTPDYVWWTNAYNLYPGGVDLRDFLYNDKYFQAMYIDDYAIPFTTQSALFDLHLGILDTTGFHSQYQEPVTVNLINGRRLNIEYHYHTGTSRNYDVFSLGLNLDDKLREVFSSAGTGMNRDQTVRTIPAENVDIVSDPLPGTRDSWTAYSEDNASSEWRTTNKRFNTSLLYTIKNIYEHNRAGDPTHIYDDFLGISTVHEFPHYSFALVERIESIYSGETRQKEINRVTIHELGHQRGLQGHADGHNGRNKTICVMHNPGDPGYGTNEWLQTLGNPTFCEGHQQKLYNIHWNQEEQ